MAKYNAGELHAMAAKGQAMKNDAGDPSFPVADEEDLGNAIHAVGMAGADHDAVRKHIIARADALGKQSMIPDNWNADGSLKTPGRSTPAGLPYTRSFALEDISIRSGGDGRTVEAYAAIFYTPAAIRDQDGEYEEVIDPTAFNRAIGLARKQTGGFNIPVMFNHGMTLFHTPSEAGTMPIGVAEEISADKRGLFTRSRYNTTPLADAALENIRDGSISAYSFAGVFKDSKPTAPRGGYRAGRDGTLQTVRRMVSTLREFGPTPFPAYAGASVVGVRAEQLLPLLTNLAPGEFERLANLFRTGNPFQNLEQPADCDTPELSGPADQDQPDDGHSRRSPRQELQARRARFIIDHKEPNYG
jgi:HK97 family phage prohead protease